MMQAEMKDTVKVHYVGQLKDGTVFDTSEGREPLSFTIGEKQVIPGFENGVIGMKESEKKKLHIPADEAYGQVTDDLVYEVNREQVPDDINLEVGLPLQLRARDGQAMNVVVTELSDDKVKLDGNHPLAGKDLTFEVTMVEIQKESE
ncbi:peptidylprolyl isomerase [candidate division KSB1 bacterium]|nr:peptidylprolyl isomerase [candidate division KSB1 bacterium]